MGVGVNQAPLPNQQKGGQPAQALQQFEHLLVHAMAWLGR